MMEVVRRMRWDHARKEGVLIDDEAGNMSLPGFVGGREWIEVGEKQVSCGYWESHINVDRICKLCGARFVG